MKPKTAKRLLRIDQVMELLQCSRSTIYRLLADRQFEAMRVGAGLRITEASLIRYQEKSILEFAESEQLL